MIHDLLSAGLDELCIAPPAGAVDALDRYAGLLLEQNKVMNLTAITAPADVASLHFLDCAALLNAADFDGKRVVDVGTGAGFPGLVLKILMPSISLTLLDSLGKRVVWLEGVCRELGLSDVECLHARAEEQGLIPGYRGGFDLAVSRAVAPLRVLCELCLPFIRVGGFFLSMKTTGSGAELSEAMNCLRLLGGRVLPAYDYAVPHTGVTHRVVPVEKISPTPPGYPRRWAKIQKAPL